MRAIPDQLIEQARARILASPARLVHGVTMSTPPAFLTALWKAGVKTFGVRSNARGRQVKQALPDASLVMTLRKASAVAIQKAYDDQGVRAFRVSKYQQLHLLVATLGHADDLTIIVHLPERRDVRQLAGEALSGLTTMLRDARDAADTLGLGYDTQGKYLSIGEHLAQLDSIRQCIVSAAVTVDLIDLSEFALSMRQADESPDLAALVAPIFDAFESLPISYSAELQLQPANAFFEKVLLPGWRAELGEEFAPSGKARTFFISYDTAQEALAREVVAVIEERGHDAIVQFRDFGQSSFVRSMREGIDRSDRFVALQSKRYWMSDHCQAEWDAAYARDPGGKNRFIIPFLVEPAPLPPIASELVYKSLFGLNAEQRSTAIAEWIDYQPKRRSQSQLRRALATQASPDVRVRDNRLDAGPNAQFDSPLVDEDLAELPGNLRAIIDTLLDALPQNTPPIVRSCLSGYRQHLIERGTQPILGTLIPFSEAVEAQTRADVGQWDVGLDTLFGHFFRRHQLLVTHFPLNPERELLLRETPIHEVNASGSRIIEPVTAAGEAIEGLRQSGLTTAEFDETQRAHQEFSRDIASLPMPASISDTVTPKRRYVLGTIGFYERVLATLGGLASIGGLAFVPGVQTAVSAAAAALRKAIETFLAFVV